MALLNLTEVLSFGFVTLPADDWENFCGEPKVRAVKDEVLMAERLAAAKVKQRDDAALNPLTGTLSEASVVDHDGILLESFKSDDTEPASVQMFKFLRDGYQQQNPERAIGEYPIWLGFNIKPVLRMAALEVARFNGNNLDEYIRIPQWMWREPPAKDPYHAALTTKAERDVISLEQLAGFFGLESRSHMLAGAEAQAKLARNMGILLGLTAGLPT